MKISALALVALMAQSVDAKGNGKGSKKEPVCYTEEFNLKPKAKHAYPVVDFKHYLVRDTQAFALLLLCSLAHVGVGLS